MRKNLLAFLAGWDAVNQQTWRGAEDTVNSVEVVFGIVGSTLPVDIHSPVTIKDEHFITGIIIISNLTKGRIAPANKSFNCLQPENASFKWFQH